MRSIKQERLARLIVPIIAIFIIASVWFPHWFSNLTQPCTPRPRLIVKSTVEFDQGWTVCTGLSSTIHGMLIDGDKLIIGDYTRDVLVAFDLASNEIQWQTPMQNYSELILDKTRQRVYSPALDGKIYAVDANTGNVVWLNDDYQGKHDGYVPLLLADGQIIGRNVFSARPRLIDAATGAFGETISAASTRVFPDGHAWVVQDGRLTAINALSGEIVWQAAEPVISDERCLNDVQVNQTTVLAKICHQLQAYDRSSGALRWTIRSDKFVTAALTDAVVYVIDLSAKLTLLDVPDGHIIGTIQFEAPESGHDDSLFSSDSTSSSQIVAAGQTVAIYFGDTDILSVYQVKLPSPS